MNILFSRLPARLKLKGGNIVPRPLDVSANIANPASPAWSSLWGGDGGTFDVSWFTRQIDLCKAQGGNAVRILGDLSALARGTLVLADYLARVDLVIAYAASKGIYVYFTLGPTQQLYQTTVSQIITQATSVLTHVQQFPSVFAVDVLQEIGTWALSGGTQQPTITLSQLTTNVASIYAALKPIATVPLTFSGAQVSFDDARIWTDTSYLSPLLPYMDFVDRHVYGTGGYIAGASDVDTLLANCGGKPLVIGEAGTPADNSRGQDYAAIAQIAAHPQVAGVFVWALGDQDTVSSNQWGIADNSGTVRSKAAVFATFPVLF